MGPERDNFSKNSCLCFGSFWFPRLVWWCPIKLYILSFYQIVILPPVFGELLSQLLHLPWLMVDCFFLGFVIFCWKNHLLCVFFVCLENVHEHWIVDMSSLNSFLFASAWALWISQPRLMFILGFLYNTGNANLERNPFWHGPEVLISDWNLPSHTGLIKWRPDQMAAFLTASSGLMVRIFVVSFPQIDQTLEDVELIQCFRSIFLSHGPKLHIFSICGG